MEEVRELFAPVLKRGGAKKAVVFGSYAREEADRYSDPDLIVIAETEKRFLDRHEEFSGLDLAWRKGLDLLIYTPDELAEILAEGSAFIKMALEQGVVIYEK